MRLTRTICHNIKALARRNRIALTVSLCNVVILTVLAYILNNQPLFTGEELNHHAWIAWIKDKVGMTEKKGHQEMLLVNVAYDKQLIERTDEYGMPIGNTDITDRTKLLEFLRLLHSSNQYQYIFLDVRFEKGYCGTEADSSLFAEIRNMKNIVIANHSDIEIADSSLMTKAAISDYKATIVATNFARYKYSYNGNASMPLYAYQEITGNTINHHGLYYSCNGRLCYNSLFIDFPIKEYEEYNEQNEKQYYNLGSDLLEGYSEEDLAILTKGKYIVIGDMVEDVHDTYSGPKPGSVITYYAFSELMAGKHFVSFGLMSFLAFIYFLISLSQFTPHSLIEQIPYIRKSKSKLLHFALSFVEYTFILLTTAIMLNIICDISISILVPSTYFAIQKTIINYKRA